MKKLDLMGIPPIIIFGTGGSGTRVVAEIIREAGCFLGSNLNKALDNQDFGFLLAGRVDWMTNKFPFKGNEAESYISLFYKVFFQQSINPNEFLVLLKIAREYISGRSKKSFRRRPIRERAIRGMRLLRSIILPPQQDLKSNPQWGFKSPEAIYFLNPFIRFFQDVKFIHVLRDGRDMVLSKNKSRLQYLEIFPVVSNNLVEVIFQNWCLVNKWAEDLCKSKVSEKQYLQIKYEEICNHPRKSVDKILAFTGLDVAKVERLYNIPKPNPSIQRWKKHRDRFARLDNSILKHFGYVEF